MSDDWIGPTSEEAEAVAREALLAAIEAIGPSPMELDEEQFDAMKRALRAFSAVDKVQREASATFKAAHPGQGYGYSLEARSIVATAFWVVKDEVDLDDVDVNPYSRVGQYWCGLIQACLALDAAASVTICLDNDGVQYGDELADEVLARLAKS